MKGILTVEETKEKWCPMERFRHCMCIASNCMMWRDAEEPEGWRIAREAQIPLRSARKFGYCGLAGKPY